MSRALLLAALCLGTGLGSGLGTATAHEGVRNPAVMAWMENMKQIGAATKVLGTMAKGAQDFDAATADAALRDLARAAALTPGLFETPQSDPKSEALPVIWENWADFTAESVALEDLARGLEGTITTQKALRRGLRKIGATCTSCHESYRE